MDYSNLTVVIPTLNEENNIGTILRKLLTVYKGIHIVVVDGGSVDKTRDCVDEIAKKSKNIRFLANPSSKLRRSVTASLTDGILASKTKYIITMDADMQHPCSVVKTIAKLLNQGNQIVPAVRVHRSNWSVYRLIMSEIFSHVGYTILVLGNKERCSDVTTGFFGIERKLFVKTYEKNRDRYVISGIRILYDTLKCIDHGEFKVVEVPFTQTDRKKGYSKMGFGQGVTAIKSFLT